MRPFEYHGAATTIGEVIRLLGDASPGATRPLAGGTDLLTLMKADLVTPERLIDIKRLTDAPNAIEETASGARLGALVTLSEIETSPLIRERYPALAEAAAAAATPQLRNLATLGGNLLQRPRCWYFRSQYARCWLQGGDDCQARDGENQLHAIFGDSPCVAVHPSDLAVALVALDAEVETWGPRGERVVPAGEFFMAPTAERRVETTLGDDELVIATRLPAPGARSTFLKAMDRKVWAFALVSVAAMARLDASGRRIDSARLVLGGVAPTPWRLETAEQALAGAEVSADLFERVAETALAGARPLAKNGYKVPLAKALIRRALSAVTGN